MNISTPKTNKHTTKIFELPVKLEFMKWLSTSANDRTKMRAMCGWATMFNMVSYIDGINPTFMSF